MVEQNEDKDTSIIADSTKAIPSGVVKGVGETVKTFELLADLADTYLGVNVSIGKEVSSRSNSPISAGQKIIDFADDTFGKANTGVGQFVEAASKFGTGMLIGGAGVKGAKATYQLAKYGRLQKVYDSSRVLVSTSNATVNKLANTAAQGAVSGAVSDFLVTGQEDTLLQDMFFSMSPDVQDSLEEYDKVGDLDLLSKKLRAIPEGILLGGLANIGLSAAGKAAKETVIPKLTEYAKRLKEKDFFGTKELLEKRAKEAEKIASKTKVDGAEEVVSKQANEVVSTEKVDIPEENIQIKYREKLHTIAKSSKEEFKNYYKSLESTTSGFKPLLSDDRQAMKEVAERFPELADMINKQEVKFSATDVVIQDTKIKEAYKVFDDIELELSKNPDDPYLQELLLYAEDVAEQEVQKFLDIGSFSGQSLSVYGRVQNDLILDRSEKAIMRRLQGREVDIDKLKTNMDLKHKAFSKVDEKVKQDLYKSLSSFQKAGKIIQSVYSNNLLSGLGTVARNFIGNATALGQKTLGRVIVALGSQDQVSKQGALAYLSRISKKQTGLEAFIMAQKAFKTRQLPDHFNIINKTDITKYDNALDSFNTLEEMVKESAENLSPYHYAISWADSIVSLPQRVNLAGDVFFRHLNYLSLQDEMLLTSISKNENSLKLLSEGGLDPLVNAKNLMRKGDYTHPAFEGLNLKDHLANFDREVKEVNLSIDPNSYQRTINNALNYVDISGIKPLRLVFPFINIPFNITRLAIQNSPVINRFSPTTQKIFREGSIQEIERKKAEILVTSIAMAGAAGLYSMGGLTDKGPADPKERAQLLKLGLKPYAIKTPEGYLPIRDFGPLGQAMQMMVHVSELVSTLDDADPDYQEKASELFAVAYTTLSDTFVPSFLSEGVANLSAYFNTDDKEGFRKFREQASKTFVNAVIPGSGLYAKNKPWFGDSSRGDYSYDGSELVKALKAQVPWLDGDILPQVDIFGNDVENSILSGEDNFELLGEIQRFSSQGYTGIDENGLESSRLFTPPSRKIRDAVIGATVNTYTFTNKEWYEYQKAAAGVYSKEDQFFNPRGKTFKEFWLEEKRQGYPGAQIYTGGKPVTDEAIVTYLRSIHKQYKDRAKAYMASKIDVLEKMNKGKAEAFEKRMKFLEGESVKFK
jgi:hypothetical protein